MMLVLVVSDTLYAVPAAATVWASQAFVLIAVSLVVAVNVNLSDAISRSISTEHRVDVRYRIAVYASTCCCRCCGCVR